MRNLICLMLCLALVFPRSGQATDLLAAGQRVLIDGKAGEITTKKISQRQLVHYIEQAVAKGWQLTEKLSEQELIIYKLERKQQEVQISYWIRQQVAVIVQVQKRKNSQRELLDKLSHPPGSLKLSFATRGKEGICLVACFKTSPGMLSDYRSRLEQDGWHRWFEGQVELWERAGERLGLSRGDGGIMVVWLMKKGGKRFARL